MGQFLRTNGDYNIKTVEGGQITLDTGAPDSGGGVVVTGNLTVQGDTVYVDVNDLAIKDNIIILNNGELGNGVSLSPPTSGIRIDRGIAPDVDFLWNDANDSWELSQIVFGIGETAFINSRLRIAELLTDVGTDTGNLLILGSESPDGVIHVTGTVDYEQQVISFGDDAIPNKKYVDDAIQTNPTSQISRDNTRVIAIDEDDKLEAILFPIGPYSWDGIPENYPETQVGISIDGDTPIAAFFRDRINLLNQGITLFTEPGSGPADNVVVQAFNSGSNLILETDGANVEITYALQLNNDSINPVAPQDTSLIYAGPVAEGQSGLYHNSYISSGVTSSGELVNKNRALLFSMIF